MIESSKPGAERLRLLREQLRELELDGFLVPKRDMFGNDEFVPARSERLAVLTGFTGSAGLAVVLNDAAVVQSDTRYTEQMKLELDPALFDALDDAEKLGPWLAAHLKAGDKIGYDPWLHTPKEIDKLRALIESAGASCKISNPVDLVWTERPPEGNGRIVTHPLKYAGRRWQKKLGALVKMLRSTKVDALVITDVASTAWLLNIRGEGDVPYAPLPLCFSIVTAGGGVTLYCDPGKPTTQVERRARIKSLDDFICDLNALGIEKATVQIDPSTAPCLVVLCLTENGAKIVQAEDPCALPKARKNKVEIAGARAAHIRDGAALTTILGRLKIAYSNDRRYWAAKLAGILPSGPVTEITVAEWLLKERRQQPLFKDLSFPTIAGGDHHGAIVHYVANEKSDRQIEKRVLIDSGAQYLDGTTDVTRTLVFGKADRLFKEAYTRVLKGLIALTDQVFPPGTKGIQLDALARVPLWQVGWDFKHGTSHGVGSYLRVHESPPRLSYAVNDATKAPLEPGMILSIEPGWYPPGLFGIRLENLVVVKRMSGYPQTMLGFDVLTVAPFDLDAIDDALLTDRERLWLDSYHERVRDTLIPLVDETTATWLHHATRFISAREELA